MTAAIAIATLAGIGYAVFVFWIRALYRECRELRQLSATQAEHLDDATTAYSELWEMAFEQHVKLEKSSGNVVRINTPMVRGKN